jgi:hypothetical protein
LITVKPDNLSYFRLDVPVTAYDGAIGQYQINILPRFLDHSLYAVTVIPGHKFKPDIGPNLFRREIGSHHHIVVTACPACLAE